MSGQTAFIACHIHRELHTQRQTCIDDDDDDDFCIALVSILEQTHCTFVMGFQVSDSIFL